MDLDEKINLVVCTISAKISNGDTHNGLGGRYCKIVHLGKYGTEEVMCPCNI